jgi:hypothetical protein
MVPVTAPGRAVGNRPHGLRHSNAERPPLEPWSLPHQNSDPKTITEEVKESIKKGVDSIEKT